MIKIEQLQNVTTKALEEINALLPQLSESAKPVTYAELLNVINDPDVSLFVAKDGGKIIGMGILIVFHTVTGTQAKFDDIVVDQAYRGQGVGEKLCRHMISITKEKRAKYIDLTSRQHRVAAHKLYLKLGFEKRDTNPYRLKL